MSNPDRLAEIHQRRTALDSAPWKTFDHDSMVIGVSHGFPHSVKSLPVAVHLRQIDAQFIAHAPDDVDWLIGEVERFRGLLKRLEWAGAERVDSPACPACELPQWVGHDSDCWLAAEIDR